MDCLFCKILEGKIPSECVAENEYAYAFNDIDPKAPIHVLIIPKKHIQSIHHISAEDGVYLTGMMTLAQEIAEKMGIDEEEKGYRLVTNYGKEGGQAVGHLHFHLLGGRQLTWPAG